MNFPVKHFKSTALGKKCNLSRSPTKHRKGIIGYHIAFDMIPGSIMSEIQGIKFHMILTLGQPVLTASFLNYC